MWEGSEPEPPLGMVAAGVVGLLDSGRVGMGCELMMATATPLGVREAVVAGRQLRMKISASVMGGGGWPTAAQLAAWE